MKMMATQPATTQGSHKDFRRTVGRRDVEDMFDEIASRWAARAERLQKSRKAKGRFRMRTLR